MNMKRLFIGLALSSFITTTIYDLAYCVSRNTKKKRKSSALAMQIPHDKRPKDTKRNVAPHKPKYFNGDVSIDGNILSKASDVTLEVGSGKLFDFPEDIGHIFISDPAIADVNILSKKSFELLGLKHGKTRLRVDNTDGQAIFRHDINVSFDLDRITSVLQNMFPDSRVSVTNFNKSIVLTGTAESSKTAADIMETLAKLTNGELNIVNHISIGTPTQVMLKVKIAKVYREVTKSLGINWRSMNLGSGFSAAIIGGTTNGALPLVLAGTSTIAANMAGTNTVSYTENTFDVNAGLKGEKDTPATVPLSKSGARWIMDYKDSGGRNIGGVIDALAEESLATILAEPTLVALSGETAKFTSGGEEPYKNNATGSATTTTTQFKEWGIMLEFSPTVISNDRIRMKVKPEVSSIEAASSAEGEKPLSKQLVETTVELGSGQSLAIAGLIKKEKSLTANELPGLASIPLLGSLFRSSNNTIKETELVIIVTPYIVKPSSKQLMTPIDNLPKVYAPFSINMLKRFYDVGKNTATSKVITEKSGFTVS